MNILVLGAGGFIGGHLCRRLKEEGHYVRGVDIKKHEYFEPLEIANEFMWGDLRDPQFVKTAFCNRYSDDSIRPDSVKWDEVYTLAADMGGAGYIFTKENDADVMHNSALINLNVANQVVLSEVGRVFYSSSACVYPEYNQLDPDNPNCEESSSVPAAPDSCYGWEKLFSEFMYDAYRRNKNLTVRIARFHNIFGPQGTWQGGKEKAPAAICRKVVETKEYKKLTAIYDDGNILMDIVDMDYKVTINPQYKDNEDPSSLTLLAGEHLEQFSNPIDIWGPGTQTRSFLYIDECVEGVIRLMRSDCTKVVNIGSEEMISINDLALMTIRISGKNLAINNIEGPTGVRGRNSHNELIYKELGWKPSLPLEQGMRKLYSWVDEQVNITKNGK